MYKLIAALALMSSTALAVPAFAQTHTDNTTLPHTSSTTVIAPPSTGAHVGTGVATTVPPTPVQTVTPSTPPVASGVPQTGANSFTEGQAQKRIADQGFSNVSGLVKDDQGVWRGKASKSGKEYSVGVDYKGNVVTR